MKNFVRVCLFIYVDIVNFIDLGTRRLIFKKSLGKISTSKFKEKDISPLTI